MATKNLGWQNKYSTTLSSGISASDTTIPLTSVPTPTEGYLIIEPDSSTAWEEIYYTSKTGSEVVCPSVGAGRGQGGSTATSHSAGATVRMDTSAEMFEALQDGTGLGDDVIKARHMDWASTGANGGIWWEEIGRTTLGSAGDAITVSSLPARKYLCVLISIVGAGANDPAIRFNSDTGSNYGFRYSANNAADAFANTQDHIELTTGENSDKLVVMYITNISTKEKIVTSSGTSNGPGGGVANPPTKWDATGKWVNTSSQISAINIFNQQAGDFGIGSEIVVLGHD